MYRLSRLLLPGLRTTWVPPLQPQHGRLPAAALRLSSGLSTVPLREPATHRPRSRAKPKVWGTTVAPGSGLEEEFVFPDYLAEPGLGEQAAPERERGGPEGPARSGAREENTPRSGRERKPRRKREQKVTGKPDPSLPSSGANCSGCGAELHCRDPTVPGYMPSEKYRSLMGLPGSGRRKTRREKRSPEGLKGSEGQEGSEGPEALVEKGRPEGQVEQEGSEGPGALGGKGNPDEQGGLERQTALGELGSVDPQKALEAAVCQRCWLLTHHHRALNMQVSREHYHSLVSAALRSPPHHGRAPLVLCMVDMLDLPDSVLPDLPQLLTDQTHVMVLGNKVDLLPGDSPRYLKHLREQLMKTCAHAGILSPAQESRSQRVVEVHLISAKTGYGVEELISKMQRSWKLNGDVYLVGATNTGKSTLFNTLLQSDYCKSKASEVINRATISPWPGTTLNLLKFPIINPTPYRMFRREKRLKEDAEKTEGQLGDDEQKYLNSLKKQGYLVGRIGRTFQTLKKKRENQEIEFDADSFAYSMEEEPVISSKKTIEKVEFTDNELKDARWFYDTPGIIKENCVFSLLTEKEVKLVLPTCSIIPRTFVLKPGMTLFLGALGRIDYLQGDRSAWFSVVASNLLPVHITTLEKADAIYQKHAGQMLLKVPMGGEERMKEFPPLIPQDIELEGVSTLEAVADIKLSSAGWVAVTAPPESKLHLRGYTPEGTELTIRKPPLLPHIVNIKGNRIKGSVAYKTKKPAPLVENMKSNVNNKKKILKSKV
uniref:Nitric oxide associated 1 n=1 Tax=Sphenodon punctatus TaxID=8508 RepID=A0A8D0HLM2_SPHPU